MINLDGGSPKFDKLYKHLEDLNVIKPFEGTLETWDYAALNDAETIAKAIKGKLGL